MALKGKGKSELQHAVDYRTNFACGNLSGKDGTWSLLKGKLPEAWWVELTGALARGDLAYVIYSYRTAIAWYDSKRQAWVIPDVHYSQSTTNHQNVVRVASEHKGFYENARW